MMQIYHKRTLPLINILPIYLPFLLIPIFNLFIDFKCKVVAFPQSVFVTDVMIGCANLYLYLRLFVVIYERQHIYLSKSFRYKIFFKAAVVMSELVVHTYT